MLSENIKILRMKKGISQEQLANHLNVVRQTVSKWEQGKSVPDADLLMAMADYFGVGVADLLGSKIESEPQDPSEIAEALARINAQLAATEQRRKNTWKTALRVIVGIVLFYVLVIILNIALGFRSYEEVGVVEEIAVSEDDDTANADEITVEVEEE